MKPTDHPFSGKIRPLWPYGLNFDQANKILLLHLEGQLLNESVAESYRAIRKYWTKTGACMGIVNFSSVTEFALSGDLIIQLAQQEPCMPDGTSRARVIVAPETHVYGLARMYQILAENTRPALSIVHTLGEAFEVLGVQSPHFEPCKENFLVTDEMAFD